MSKSELREVCGGLPFSFFGLASFAKALASRGSPMMGGIEDGAAVDALPALDAEEEVEYLADAGRPPPDVFAPLPPADALSMSRLKGCRSRIR